METSRADLSGSGAEHSLFLKCSSFFPSYYGSHLTIIWKLPHAASV